MRRAEEKDCYSCIAATTLLQEVEKGVRYRGIDRVAPTKDCRLLGLREEEKS